MNPYRAERLLAYFYTIGCLCALLATICTSILWLHWRVVLNTCAGNFQTYPSYYDERDCGCFIYASDTLSYFVGSSVGWCYYGAFGLIPPLLVFFILGIYHVFRVCFKSEGQPRAAKTEFTHRSNEVMQLTIEQELQHDSVSPNYWMPATLVALVMVIYSLIHAILLTDGLWHTCKQYRNRVVKYTHASGPMVGVLQRRLSCGAIFDFMDYLHEDLSFERRRDYQINSGIPYYISLFSVWIALACWVGIIIISIRRYRDSRHIRV